MNPYTNDDGSRTRNINLSHDICEALNHLTSHFWAIHYTRQVITINNELWTVNHAFLLLLAKFSFCFWEFSECERQIRLFLKGIKHELKCSFLDAGLLYSRFKIFKWILKYSQMSYNSQFIFIFIQRLCKFLAKI